MFGLTEDTMSRMLLKGFPSNLNREIIMSEIVEMLIPNIVEVLAANNEVILSQLEEERTNEDSGKAY